MTITPLGAAVEPEVYCRKAKVAGLDARVAPGVGQAVVEAEVGGEPLGLFQLGNLGDPAGGLAAKALGRQDGRGAQSATIAWSRGIGRLGRGG